MRERLPKLILAAITSLMATPVGIILAWQLLFFTPFVPRPLFERLPRVREQLCPSGTSVMVEHYSRNLYNPQAKYYDRVLCVDGSGKRIKEVTNEAHGWALGLSALVIFLLLLPPMYWWAGRLPTPPPASQHVGKRGSRFMALMSVALALYLLWAIPYLFRQ
ncbi:MAG TPA: hypothetical protein VK689_00955, partial [Armatimonadota bacterium]|nr:hypothetical protein [Armatimonadota bacterium]